MRNSEGAYEVPTQSIGPPATNDIPGGVMDNEMWATVDLMGHVQLAGRITKPESWGGLIQLDIPISPTEFRTELIGMPAIYKISFVSEEIARAYAAPERGIIEYSAPIVTREQHQAAMGEIQRRNDALEDIVRQLQRRLTAVSALPERCEEELGRNKA